MPELPEVERVRLTLTPHLVGRTIKRAMLHRADICESFSRTSAGFKKVRTTPAALLEGDTVETLLRHGKQIAIIGDSGRVLCVHLGMSGQLRWKTEGTEIKATHTHAEWVPAPDLRRPEGRLIFRDPRRFGGLWTFDSLADLREARWNTLGPDALAIRAETLKEGLGKSTRVIKAALLDQTVIAGVGNIYADEALFLSAIRPTRRVNRLTAAEVRRLAAAIPEVLHPSIETGGTTLRDYVDANGEKGKGSERNAVYGRGGLPCLRCGKRLRQAIVGGRTTVWCATCQR